MNKLKIDDIQKLNNYMEFLYHDASPNSKKVFKSKLKKEILFDNNIIKENNNSSYQSYQMYNIYNRVTPDYEKLLNQYKLKDIPIPEYVFNPKHNYIHSFISLTNNSKYNSNDDDEEIEEESELNRYLKERRYKVIKSILNKKDSSYIRNVLHFDKIKTLERISPRWMKN
tara:strand:+ start:24 stop:533 length:510 start_codon:yes stop_codon:yes gene_type:complete